MRIRHAVLALGLAGSAALLAFGDSETVPDSPPSTRMARLAQAVEGGPPVHKPWVMTLVARDELIGEAAEAGAGAAFRSQSWTPPAEPGPEHGHMPEPPPSAPPLPFRYIGKARAGNGWEVYLSQGERVHVVRPDEVIDGTYRVGVIAPPSMTLVFLPLEQVQSIDIGAGE